MNQDGSERSILRESDVIGWLTPCGHSVFFLADEPGANVLMRVEADGTNATKLVRGSLWAPACSSDAKFIFYVNQEMPQKIWRMPIEGGTPTVVAQVLGDGIVGRLSLSPDGKLLAYAYVSWTQPSSFGWNMVIIPVDGNTKAIKTFKVPASGGPYWSPDGNGLQYVVAQNQANNIWEQPLNGGKPKQLTHFTSGLIFDFDWSPDRKRLLLVRGDVESDAVLLNNLH